MKHVETVNDNSRAITALLQWQKKFTRQLQALPTAARGLINGPHRKSPSAEGYGNVMLFASGIGVIAHLRCAKHLLSARGRLLIRTQVISLSWEADQIELLDANIKMVHQLLNQDVD